MLIVLLLWTPLLKGYSSELIIQFGSLLRTFPAIIFSVRIIDMKPLRDLLGDQRSQNFVWSKSAKNFELIFIIA